MPRTFVALVLSITALLVLGAPAAHAGKPTIGILGLEVIDDGGGIDAKTTQFAKELTEALRQRPKTGTGPYALAPGSDKDLLEMKLLSGCENEGKDCMAAIGADLGADRLLFGKIEKRSNGYQVSLKLLNVSAKTNERSISDIVPFAESTGANLASWGKKLYAKLTGVTDQGTLIIKANVDRGTVYLDGQVKGNLSGGTARVAGLSEGAYELAIEAEGHLRYEAKIDIGAGEDTTHEAELEKNAIKVGPDGDGKGPTGDGDGKGPGGGLDGDGVISGSISADERPGGGYRALFWASLAATAGSATGMTVFGLKVRGSDEEAKETAIRDWQTASGMQLDLADACGDASTRLDGQGVTNRDLLVAVDDKCAAGKSHAMLANVFIGTTAVAAVATVFFYYKGFVASKTSTESVNKVGSRRGRKSQKAVVTVVPTFTPTQVSAGVRIDF